MEIDVPLTLEEIAAIRDALDSHIYWELSDHQYRSSGHVLAPGSRDPETAKRIKWLQCLFARFEMLASHASGQHLGASVSPGRRQGSAATNKSDSDEER